MTEEELFAIDTQIPERIWEVTYQLPNGDWHWRSTDMMTFEQACRNALEFKYPEHTLIRIERVPAASASSPPTTVVGGDPRNWNR